MHERHGWAWSTPNGNNGHWRGGDVITVPPKLSDFLGPVGELTRLWWCSRVRGEDDTDPRNKLNIFTGYACA